MQQGKRVQRDKFHYFTGGVDYSSVSRTFIFDEATTEICVNISTVDDILFENDEIFIMALNTEDDAVLVQNGILVTIIDDDVNTGT